MLNNAVIRRSTFRRGDRRSGIATLELVFVLPFFLMLMSMIFAISFASQERTRVTIQARHDAWQKRSVVPGNTEPFKFIGTGSSGKLQADPVRTVKVFPLKRYPRDIKVHHELIAGTWDHQEITGFTKTAPHLSVLQQLVSHVSGLPAGIVNSLSPLAKVTNAFGF